MAKQDDYNHNSFGARAADALLNGSAMTGAAAASIAAWHGGQRLFSKVKPEKLLTKGNLKLAAGIGAVSFIYSMLFYNGNRSKQEAAMGLKAMGMDPRDPDSQEAARRLGVASEFNDPNVTAEKQGNRYADMILQQRTAEAQAPTQQR